MSDRPWLEQLVWELKGSCPGLGLSLSHVPEAGAVAIGYLRVPMDLRYAGHGLRILRRICAEADARGLAVVCTPTGEYGSNRTTLVTALQRAGFTSVDDDPSEHTMRRPPGDAPQLVTPPARRGAGGAER